MSSVLTVNATTATTATIAFTNLPVGGSVEIQITTNKNFFGMVSSATYGATPAAVTGLNQLGTFFARGRTVTAGGVKGAWGATVGFYTPVNVAWNTAPQNVLVDLALVVPPEALLAFPTQNAIAGYPATNLDRDDPQLIYASANPDFTIQTAGAPIDTFAFLDTLAPEAATISFRAGNTQAEAEGGAPAYSLLNQTFRASANLPNRPSFHSLIRLPLAKAYPFWRITVTGGLRQGTFQARYFVAGLARLAKNIAADKAEAGTDLGSLERTRAGGPDRAWGHRMRKVDFDIALLSEMQWETQFGDLWRKIGLTEPCLVVPNSRAGAFLHDRILYGNISQSRSTNINSPRFTHGFSIDSLI